MTATRYPPLAVLRFHAERMSRTHGPENEMKQVLDAVCALVVAGKDLTMGNGDSRALEVALSAFDEMH